MNRAAMNRGSGAKNLGWGEQCKFHIEQETIEMNRRSEN
jgi:hypothetical protein